MRIIWMFLQIQMTKLDGPPSVSEDGGLRAARVCGHLIQRDGRYGLVPIEKNSASAFQVGEVCWKLCFRSSLSRLRYPWTWFVPSILIHLANYQSAIVVCM